MFATSTDTNSGYPLQGCYLASYICNKLIRPPNPPFCLGHSERLSCLLNTVRLKFSKNMFKPSFKNFSSQHLLTKLFQLEKKWEEARSLLSFSLIS